VKSPCEGPEPQAKYRPEIDGLRAIAVLAVIINHIDKGMLPSGHLGVDIFFVISGFVITSSMANRPDRDLKNFLLSFYARRVKRLLPALVFFVVCASLLICMFNPSPRESILSGIASLFGFSNIYLYKLATDYFSPLAELNIFTHTWSLGVEEQFYLLFPFLAWSSGYVSQGSRGARNFALVTGVLSIISLLSFLLLNRTNPPAGFFLMTSRFWELGSGCLMFLALKSSPGASKTLKRMPPLLPLMGMLVLLFHETTSSGVVLLVILTALLIACVRPGTFIFQILTDARLLYIGLISYSLYLWHWGILTISRWTVGINWATIPIQGIMIFGVAAMSYHFIEKPLRRASWHELNQRTIMMGLSASAGASGFLLLIGMIPGISLFTGRLSPQFKNQQSFGGYYILNGSTQNSGNSVWAGPNCILGGDRSQIGRKIQMYNCTLGNSASARHRVLVAGNSFSATFPPGFDQLVLEDHFSVTITSALGAAPVPGLSSDSPRYVQTSNYYWNHVFPGHVAELRQGDWVFLASDIQYYSPPARSASDEKNLLELEHGIRALHSQLAPRGIRLAFLSTVPFIRDSHCDPVVLATIQSNHPSSQGPCRFYSKRDTIMRMSAMDGMLKRLQADGTISIIDLLDILCPSKTCTFTDEKGTTLYLDSASHPSVQAIRKSAPLIRKILSAPVRSS
jgi:peptidoglycan/LPS O-acetylase OafA/YrhL